MRYFIDPRDKPGLLIAVMNAFASPTTRISLEGVLGGYSFNELEQPSHAESPPLERNTIDPILDFVVAPLSPRNAKIVSKAISKKNGLSSISGIIHVQIAIGSELAFGGYDQFNSECVSCERLSPEFLADLKQKGVIRGFKEANDA